MVWVEVGNHPTQSWCKGYAFALGKPVRFAVTLEVSVVYAPDCSPKTGLPSGLSNDGRAFAIVRQRDEREARAETEGSDADWLALNESDPIGPKARKRQQVLTSLATLGEVIAQHRTVNLADTAVTFE